MYEGFERAGLARMDKMKIALVLLCCVSFAVAIAEASEFWDDFYVNFGDWKVKYPGMETGKIVDLALDQETGNGFQSILMKCKA